MKVLRHGSFGFSGSFELGGLRRVPECGPYMRRPGMHEGAGLHYGPSAGPRLFRLGLGAIPDQGDVSPQARE